MVTAQNGDITNLMVSFFVFVFNNTFTSFKIVQVYINIQFKVLNDKGLSHNRSQNMG